MTVGSQETLSQLKARLCAREQLTPSECEHALLPNLEHATSVHSRVHHYQHPPNAHQPASPLSSAPSLALSASLTSSTTNSSHETFDQTKNAIIYISLVVVVYVVVVLWLVSSNFRQAASNARERGNSGFNTVARNIVRKVANFQGINRSSDSRPIMSSSVSVEDFRDLPAASHPHRTCGGVSGGPCMSQHEWAQVTGHVHHSAGPHYPNWEHSEAAAAMAAAVCCSGGVDENYEVTGGPDGDEDDDDDDPELEALLVVRADRGGSSVTTTNLEQQEEDGVVV